MIDFHPITIDDKQWIKTILQKADKYGCDYNFTVALTWGQCFKAECANLNGWYLYRSMVHGEIGYLFPVGNGDTTDVIWQLIELSKSTRTPLLFFSVLDEDVEFLNLKFPGMFELKSDRNSFEYIYETEKMKNLAGKKLASKRNHIHRFEDSHQNYRLEKITPDNIHDVLAYNQKWYESRLALNSKELRQEQFAIEKMFDHYFELDVIGAALYDNQKIIGYTVGEKLNSNSYLVHIEKAEAEIQGAYPVLNKLFVENYLSDSLFINREDDGGEEGLRKAKLSYQPFALLKKSTAMLRFEKLK